MSYSKIASEDITLRNIRFLGSRDTYTFEIHERFADPETVTEIGIEGEPLFVMGSSGNDMFYPFWPIQIQFTIKDKLGWLRKFDSRSKKDFKLIVKNGAAVEFDLFLYLPSSDSYYYEASPDLELIATNGLGFLKEEYFKPEDNYIELSEFILECRNRLGYSFDVHFYSQWSSENNAKTFPLGYRAKRLHLSRFTDENRISYWQVLTNFCEQFNLQIYQIDNSWLIIERKEKLKAPVTLNGVDLGTEAVVQSDFRQELTNDQVVRKPKQRFKSGLKEIKTEFKLFDELLINADFSESNFITRKAHGWQQPLINELFDINGNQVYLTIPFKSDESGLILNADEYYDELGNSVGYQNGFVVQKTQKSISGDDLINLSWDGFTNSGGTGFTVYAKLTFRALDGSIYTYDNAENQKEWKNITSTVIRDIDFVDGYGRFEEILPAPEGKAGFLEIKFTCEPDESGVLGYVAISNINIDIQNEFERASKIYINSRGLKNPSSKNLTFGTGDLDDFSDLFIFEYENSTPEWVEAEYINNDGSSRKVFECAPYDRLCQANKDKVEHANLSSLKYLCPDFTKTIVLKDANEVDLNLIQLEYKWNMVTGQIEIYATEAFEDTIGITRLAFYSEEEYEAIDENTVIADDGQVFLGYTRGADSADDRGFEVEFNSPQSVTSGMHTIEVDGVNYELETLILEEV